MLYNDVLGGFCVFFLITSFFMLTSYVTGGNSFPAILTPEEEEKYLNAYNNNGDIEAKNKLIVHNLRLVAHIAKKYSNQNPDTASELISIGTIGLIKGVNTYKLGHKTKLATYAAKCIENAILLSVTHITPSLFLHEKTAIFRTFQEDVNPITLHHHTFYNTTQEL